MTSWWSVAVMVVALILVPLRGEAATVRIGLFVGANVGMGTDEPLGHAEREARDLAKLFQDMGDLSPQRSTVILGETARTVREAMRTVEAQVREAEARGDHVMLVFYYSGHATRAGLHMAGSQLDMEDLRHWLETSRAQVRVAFVDACESGSLARTRGGTPVDAIQVSVDESLTMSGLAIIASTGPLSVARESEAFGGGVFSRALMTGLRGSADVNGDGSITLDEAYQHAFAETVVQTAADTSGIQRPELRIDLEGRGDVVLTRIPNRASGLVLPEESEGAYRVVSIASGEVVAAIDKEPGELKRVALPSGRYIVRKVRREDVLVAELDLVWGGDRWVEDGQMTTVALGDPLARGGWRPRPVRLALRGGVTSPLLQGWPLVAGGEFGLRGQLIPRLALEGHVGVMNGFRDEATSEVGAFMVRAGLVAMGTWSLRQVDLSLGGGLGVAFVRQHIESVEYDEDLGADDRRETMEQWLPSLVVQTGAHLPVGPTFGFDLNVRAQLHRGVANDAPGFFVDAQALAGVTARFGGRRVARVRRHREAGAKEDQDQG